MKERAARWKCTKTALVDSMMEEVQPHIEGDQMDRSIVAANGVCKRVAIIMRICAARGVHCIVEAIDHSMFFDHPVIRHALVELGYFCTVSHMCRLTSSPLPAFSPSFSPIFSPPPPHHPSPRPPRPPHPPSLPPPIFRLLLILIRLLLFFLHLLHVSIILVWLVLFAFLLLLLHLLLLICRPLILSPPRSPHHPVLGRRRGARLALPAVAHMGIAVVGHVVRPRVQLRR
eukprot:4276824-Pyramimonas_sp.AAC.3